MNDSYAHLGEKLTTPAGDNALELSDNEYSGHPSLKKEGKFWIGHRARIINDER
jgi:hypothetical protein